ncbi:MAG: hypothetical protein AAFQ84_08210 [Pseudomonadota bacterium]
MRAFRRLAIRDASIVAATIVAWLSLGHLSADHGWTADAVGAGLGVAAALVAWIAHEWGHLVFGSAVGATFRAPTKIATVYLFGFDNRQNSRTQFITMALGGFAATAIALWCVFNLLPADWMATRVVRGLVLIEALAIVVLELPGLLFGIVAYGRLPSVDVLGE